MIAQRTRTRPKGWLRRRADCLVAVGVVGVVAACSSFGADDASPAPAPADGGTSETGTDGAICAAAAAYASDPKNCGRCGHDCLGGDCADGVCQPVQLASFEANRAVGVAASSTHFGWAAKVGAVSSVKWCALNDVGCAAPSVGAILADAESITATEDAIYAAGEGGTNGQIVRIAPDGLRDVLRSEKENFQYPFALFPGPDGITFLDYYDGPQAVGVFRLGLGAPPVAAPKIASLDGSTGHRWDHVVAPGNRVYLSEYIGGIATATVPTESEPAAFCPSATCSTHGVSSLATDGASIFWANLESNDIVSCAIGDTCSSPVTIATKTTLPEQPRHLAIDGARLYIATDPGGEDGKAKLFGCAPTECARPLTPLAEAAWLPAAPFVTADAIYWLAGTTRGPDAGADQPELQTYHVMRVAK